MVRVAEEGATMDNREEIFDALNDFEKKPTKEIPPLLEQFLRQVAKTGETLFPWPRLKPLFVSKLIQVMTQFHQEIAVDHFPPNSNMEHVKFDDMRDRIINAVERFHGAPFTIQRLCELITEPKRHYKRSDKFLRGIEKNVLVVSTVDPFGRKVVSESRNLVNGLDTNGCQQANALPPPPVPNWAVNNPGATVWPQTNIESDEEMSHPNGKEQDTLPLQQQGEEEEEERLHQLQQQQQEQGEESEQQLEGSHEETQETPTSCESSQEGEDEEMVTAKSESEVSSTDVVPSEDENQADKQNQDNKTTLEHSVEVGSGEATPLVKEESVESPPEKIRKTEEADTKPVPEPSSDVQDSVPDNGEKDTPKTESVPAVSEGTQVSSSDVNLLPSQCDNQNISTEENNSASSEDVPSSSDTPSQQQCESEPKQTDDCASSVTASSDRAEPVISNSTCAQGVAAKEDSSTSLQNSCEKSETVDSSEQVMDTDSDSCRTSEPPSDSDPQQSTPVQQEEPTETALQSEEPMDQD